LDSIARIERKRKILELLSRRNFGIEELAKLLNISPITLRKDLQDLQKQGLINRVWGGVTLASHASKEQPFEDKDVDSLKEKRIIARTALTLVKSNEVIGLGGGTTTFELSKLLVDITNIQVITNSINTAYMLLRLGIRIIMPGGISREGSYSLVNHKINEFFDGIFLDKYFLEVDGIDIEGGLTTLRSAEVELMSTMISVANTVIVLADSTKLGQRRFTTISPIEKIDLLITDHKAPQDIIRIFEKKGIKIEIASSEGYEEEMSMSAYKFK